MPIAHLASLAHASFDLGRSFCRVGGDVEADPLPLVEARQSRSLDRANMNEHVGATPFLLDEPKALLRIKPLHFACRHARSPFQPSSPYNQPSSRRAATNMIRASARAAGV